MRTCSRSAPSSSSGAASTSISCGSVGHHAQPPRHERQRRALQQRQHDDQHEHGVDEPLRVRRALLQRDERQHDRHRTAQPGPRQERLLAPRHPERRRRRDHRQRPRGHDQHDPGDERGDDGLDQPARRGVEPEQHEQPDLRQPARALGERQHVAAVREVGVAEHQRGDVGREQPGGVRELPAE